MSPTLFKINYFILLKEFMAQLRRPIQVYMYEDNALYWKANLAGVVYFYIFFINIIYLLHFYFNVFVKCVGFFILNKILIYKIYCYSFILLLSYAPIEERKKLKYLLKN